jgi:lysophospholipase L1-like esterase
MQRGLLLLILFFSFLIPVNLFAQTQLPFWDEIQAFKKQDSIHPPPQHAILFVGSSSIRFWKDVQRYFPDYTPIINRGFGGSHLPDLIRYANDIIFPYHPREIVIYCGENDFEVDTVSAITVFDRFKTLYHLIRTHLGEVPIVYISIKPAPVRYTWMNREDEANWYIKNYISTLKNIHFVDVFHYMLNSYGRPIPGIFRSDSLHMLPNGYAIWQKQIRPYLIK